MTTKTTTPSLSAALLLALAASCETTTTEKQSHMLSEGTSGSVLDSRLRKLEGEAVKYPLRSDLWYEIAAVHFQKPDYRGSAEALGKAIHLDPHESRYHYQLGRVHLKMGELNKAERCFREAVSLAGEGRYTGPRAALGYTLSRKRDLPGAIAEFERCRSLEPENPMYYFLLGSLHDMNGDREAAIKGFQEYLARGGTKHRRKAIEVLGRLGVAVDETAPVKPSGQSEEILPE
ncbi:MAG: tetratricopeptide repeat protein [Planctomycetes bacterium]|nr:tetratricopeptide repeat protein [Planctomycetota bacterium]